MRRLPKRFSDYLEYLEGTLAWLFAVIGAFLLAVAAVGIAAVAFGSVTPTDAIFVLGVTTATTAAAADTWSHLFRRRRPEEAAKLGLVASLLTWAGLAFACWSATRTDFEPLPPRSMVEFFLCMTLVSVLGAWFFAQVSRRAPRRPRRTIDAS